ncbi:hypothetical protein BABINDRAFT_154693 [Babjeviella inositovora NRRL Y-12698]|uniref:Secreted protein n=1 Tax=Babjeviella inositovora NRRL Y-12698 TaxID=984486 RepID=A0A1E3QMI4_9ASCO|nr:uncharacterized protein BABINDRAFT_154693 [Babjeviella inositovora NRRL Y-12698]ODQ78881.1 hypothetical protein BABINDRAFT_154693 [Babjeviella inositovora NRRL Y-12698]
MILGRWLFLGRWIFWCRVGCSQRPVLHQDIRQPSCFDLGINKTVQFKIVPSSLRLGYACTRSETLLPNLDALCQTKLQGTVEASKDTNQIIAVNKIKHNPRTVGYYVDHPKRVNTRGNTSNHIFGEAHLIMTVTG